MYFEIYQRDSESLDVVAGYAVGKGPLGAYTGEWYLTICESKSAVAGAFGRKFLGFALYMARTREVKRAVSKKALETFRQRIRQLTRRSGGRSIGEVMKDYVPMCSDGRATSGWRKPMQSCPSWTNGCVTGCGPST